MGQRPKFAVSSPVELRDLMKDCWKAFPEERPEFDAVLLSLGEICSRLRVNLPVFPSVFQALTAGKKSEEESSRTDSFGI